MLWSFALGESPEPKPLKLCTKRKIPPELSRKKRHTRRNKGNSMRINMKREEARGWKRRKRREGGQ